MEYMDTGRKAWYYSLVLLLVCLLISIWVYAYTGHLILIILFAPPLVYWWLKSRENKTR